MADAVARNRAQRLPNSSRSIEPDVSRTTPKVRASRRPGSCTRLGRGDGRRGPVSQAAERQYFQGGFAEVVAVGVERVA